MSSFVGIDPDRLRRLASKLDQADGEVRAIQAQIDQILAPVGYADPAAGNLSQVERWLASEAADARRRAAEVVKGPDWTPRSVGDLVDQSRELVTQTPKLPAAWDLITKFLKLKVLEHQLVEVDVLKPVVRFVHDGDAEFVAMERAFDETGEVLRGSVTVGHLSAGHFELGVEHATMKLPPLGEIDAASEEMHAAELAHEAAGIRVINTAGEVLAPATAALDVATILDPPSTGLGKGFNQGVAGVSLAATGVEVLVAMNMVPGLGQLADAVAGVVLAGAAAYWLTTWIVDNRRMLANALVSLGKVIAEPYIQEIKLAGKAISGLVDLTEEAWDEAKGVAKSVASFVSDPFGI